MMDLGTSTHRRLLGIVAVLFVVTAVGIVALWPRATDLPQPYLRGEAIYSAEIRSIQSMGSESDPVTGRPGEIAFVSLRLLEGPDAGEIVSIELLTEGYPDFAVGDRVRLARHVVGDSDAEYYITDFERLPILAILLGVFVGAVLLISRWHGLRALIGLGASLFIVIQFVVPAILAGQPPPLVAWVGAMAVMIVTLYLTHGFNEMTTSAVVGTGASLSMTVALALLFIDRAKITGFASDDAVFARFAVEGLDLQGLVLAGLIIASLGVLDDVTVSQASTVFALHDTDRRLSWAALFARAMRVGRDHIASVVNTLFLAYAGASLALLVLFSTSGLAVGEIVNSEVLAEEIVKTVVGSLGLIAAVPFTTALAALVAVRRPGDAPLLGEKQLRGDPASVTARRASRMALYRSRGDDELYAQWLASIANAPPIGSASPDIDPTGEAPATVGTDESNEDGDDAPLSPR